MYTGRGQQIYIAGEPAITSRTFLRGLRSPHDLLVSSAGSWVEPREQVVASLMAGPMDQPRSPRATQDYPKET